MEKNYVLKLMEVDALIRRIIDAKFDAIVLAFSLGISVRTLERCFHERFGCTPANGIEIIRLNIGCILIEAGTRTKDIANALSYRHASHFCQRFKRRFGQSPSVWRASSKQQPLNDSGNLLLPSLSLKHNLLHLYRYGSERHNGKRQAHSQEAVLWNRLTRF